jgi:hypothetical protein
MIYYAFIMFMIFVFNQYAQYIYNECANFTKLILPRSNLKLDFYIVNLLMPYHCQIKIPSLGLSVMVTKDNDFLAGLLFSLSSGTVILMIMIGIRKY